MMTTKIIDFYTHRYNESDRHQGAFGIIQELRTMELISRYLPNNRASILDVGGATGVYSFQLADIGHRVTLLNILFLRWLKPDFPFRFVFDIN